MLTDLIQQHMSEPTMVPGLGCAKCGLILALPETTLQIVEVTTIPPSQWKNEPPPKDATLGVCQCPQCGNILAIWYLE